MEYNTEQTDAPLDETHSQAKRNPLKPSGTVINSPLYISIIRVYPKNDSL